MHVLHDLQKFPVVLVSHEIDYGNSILKMRCEGPDGVVDDQNILQIDAFEQT